MNKLEVTAIKQLQTLFNEQINPISSVTIHIQHNQCNDFIKNINDKTSIFLLKVNEQKNIKKFLNKISDICDSFNLKINLIGYFDEICHICHFFPNNILTLHLMIHIEYKIYINKCKKSKKHLQNYCYLPNSITKLNFNHKCINSSFLNNKLTMLEFFDDIIYSSQASDILKKIPFCLKTIKTSTKLFNIKKGKIINLDDQIINNNIYRYKKINHFNNFIKKN
jgi:hypothetical protein